MTEAKEFVFVVKFDLGYYAKKQSHYHWSYTDDLLLANMFKTRTAAEDRAHWGVNLMKTEYDTHATPKSVVVEQYEITKTFTQMS